MKHFVLDLETLGTSRNSVVCAIGVQTINPTASDGMGPSFYQILPDWEEQERMGRKIDSNTVKWWLKQALTNPEAAQELLPQPTPGAVLRPDTCSILAELGRFIRDCAPDPEQREVWGNSSSFDNEILRSLYEDYNIVPAWTFRQDRCYRTMRELYKAKYPAAIEAFNENKGTLHHALEDAKYEARILYFILTELGLLC